MHSTTKPGEVKLLSATVAQAGADNTNSLRGFARLFFNRRFHFLPFEALCSVYSRLEDVPSILS